MSTLSRRMTRGLLVLLSLLCSAHLWAYDFEEDNIQYTVISLDDLTAEVSGLSDKNLTEVVIPETVEYKSRTLTITSIGSSAFYNCTSLLQVTIPESVVSIGSSAFYNCTSLALVTITNSVTSIGSSAFRGCSGLTEMNIPESVTSISSSTFYGCTGLTEVNIPESVTEIGNSAFYGCSGLTEVTISESVTKIGSSAFQNCTGLTQVNYNATACTSAGSSSNNRAFRGCSNISTFNFGGIVTIIPDYLCYELKNLAEVTMGNKVETIGDYAFYNCSSLKEFDIPNSVTSLGNYALNGCNGLETLKIGTGLIYLHDYETRKRSPAGGIYYYYYYYPLLWENGPSDMESIILKDGTSDFRVRGYGYTYLTDTNNPKEGKPMFSNINVGYYYVSRPLIDVDSWSYLYESRNIECKISVSRPYGTIKTLEINGYCTEVPYFYQSIEYLVLGENVETYEAENIYQGNLKGIICRSAVPPTLSGTFENSTYVNTIVYVPIGSKATYEATDGWKTFWDIQELDMKSIPPGYDAVESITAYGKADVIGYYTIDGKKVSTPQRGINIIRYSDGSTRKVLMK